MNDSYVNQALQELCSDSFAAAAEIAERSADLFLRQARTHLSSAEDLRTRLLESGWTLIRAHPTMAPLVNLVSQLLFSIDEITDLALMRNQIAATATDFKRRLHVHEAAVAERSLPLLPEGGTVVVVGRSTTVRAALLHSQRAGRRFRVLCAEGRPGLEGRTMATELAAAGLQVTVAIDAVVIATVAEAQLALVGADHLTANALVNKVGTYGLAVAAQASRVPVYALCGSEKFLPVRYQPPALDSLPQYQVWASPPHGVQVVNRHYDHTPLNVLSGVVTERGIILAEGLEAWLAALPLHPALQNHG